MIYSKAKANAQTQMASLKYVNIEEGEVLTFQDILESEYDQNGVKVPNDAVKCEDKTGKFLKLPVREFLKMDTGSDKHYKGEAGEDDIKFPTSITIKSKSDRKDRDGNVTYPLFAYNKAAEFMAEGSTLEWEDLLKGGVKADNKFSPVQDYVVTVQF